MKSLQVRLKWNTSWDYWDIIPNDGHDPVDGGLCWEELVKVFPDIDWGAIRGRSVICTIKRSRSTGFKTFRITDDNGVDYTYHGHDLKYGRSGHKVYIAASVTRWLERQDISRNGVFYVKMEVV